MYAQPLPNNADRAKWATSLLIINLCLFAVMTIRDLLKLVAEGLYYSNYSVVQIAESGLEIGQSLLMITTAVFFIMWFRRAYNNLHIAGARFLPYKEGWAAGGWFVPILNWFYPYRIANAIWVETPVAIRKVGEHYDRPQTSPVGAWWTFWLIGNIVASIQTQIILRSGAGLYSPAVVITDFISDVSMLLAAIFAMRMIKGVSEMEVDLQRRYNEWLAYQTQQHAQQFQQQTSSQFNVGNTVARPDFTPPKPPDTTLQ